MRILRWFLLGVFGVSCCVLVVLWLVYIWVSPSFSLGGSIAMTAFTTCALAFCGLGVVNNL